jgi:hypothetical protein
LIRFGCYVNFPINIFIDYLGLPNDSTHFNVKQNKRNDAHAMLRCIETRGNTEGVTSSFVEKKYGGPALDNFQIVLKIKGSSVISSAPLPASVLSSHSRRAAHRPQLAAAPHVNRYQKSCGMNIMRAVLQVGGELPRRVPDANVQCGGVGVHHAGAAVPGPALQVHPAGGGGRSPHLCCGKVKKKK